MHVWNWVFSHNLGRMQTEELVARKIPTSSLQPIDLAQISEY